jgi:flagellar motor switch protein FliM
MNAIADPFQHSPLDPTLLGRPVHLLHRFAAQLRHDLTGLLRQSGQRRQWGELQISALVISPGAPLREGRWLDFDAGGLYGTVGFMLGRDVLLAVLNRRYGAVTEAAGVAVPAAQHGDPVAPPVSVPAAVLVPAAVPVSATEERLLVALGQQLVAALVARVHANLPAGSRPPPPAAAEWRAGPAPAPAAGGWIACVSLFDAGSGQHGQFSFALAPALLADILHGLLPPAARHPAPAGADRRPFAARLALSLDGRLTSKQVTLDGLMTLRVGDVVPISLGRIDVLLDEVRLFTATVCEHHGKLCLTSFDDAD